MFRHNRPALNLGTASFEKLQSLIIGKEHTEHFDDCERSLSFGLNSSIRIDIFPILV